MAIGEQELLDKLRRLVLAEDKLVSYKSACSYLDVGCQQSKALLQKLLDSAPNELESTHLICGEQKEGSHMCFKVVPRKELEATKGAIGKVTMEHVYSVWKKKSSSEEDKLLTDKTTFSERHYQGDLDVMQDKWLDRKNIMTDQPLLDHRWSQIGATEHTRTKPRRPQNLCSPKKKKSPAPVKFDPFASKSKVRTPKKMDVDEKEPAPPASKKRKLDSTSAVPPKKKAKMGIAAMFGKAAKKQSKEEDKKSKQPAPSKKKKGGLFGFFKKSDGKTNPFEALKKDTSKPVFGKSKAKKSSKKKAVKAKKKKGAKPKKPLKEKKATPPTPAAPPPPPPVADKEEMENLFADEESEEDDQMRMMRNEDDEDSEDEVPIEVNELVVPKSRARKKKKQRDAFKDTDSEGESPVKQLTKKEKREIAKQEREKAKKEAEDMRKQKLKKRKATFWGSATGKTSQPSGKRKVKKMKTRSYIDEATGMLVTEDVEVSESDEDEKVPGGGTQEAA